MSKRIINERKIITERVYEFSPLEIEGTLKQVRDWINREIKEYGLDARLDYNRYHHEPYDENPSPRFYILKNRLETDDEFKKRKIQEEQREAEQLARDRQLLKELKERLGE